jgi:hypothetical protein
LRQLTEPPGLSTTQAAAAHKADIDGGDASGVAEGDRKALDLLTAPG